MLWQETVEWREKKEAAISPAGLSSSFTRSGCDQWHRVEIHFGVINAAPAVAHAEDDSQAWHCLFQRWPICGFAPDLWQPAHYDATAFLQNSLSLFLFLLPFLARPRWSGWLFLLASSKTFKKGCKRQRLSEQISQVWASKPVTFNLDPHRSKVSCYFSMHLQFGTVPNIPAQSQQQVYSLRHEVGRPM